MRTRACIRAAQHAWPTYNARRVGEVWLELPRIFDEQTYVCARGHWPLLAWRGWRCVQFPVVFHTIPRVAQLKAVLAVVATSCRVVLGACVAQACCLAVFARYIDRAVRHPCRKPLCRLWPGIVGVKKQRSVRKTRVCLWGGGAAGGGGTLIRRTWCCLPATFPETWTFDPVGGPVWCCVYALWS